MSKLLTFCVTGWAISFLAASAAAQNEITFRVGAQTGTTITKKNAEDIYDIIFFEIRSRCGEHLAASFEYTELDRSFVGSAHIDTKAMFDRFLGTNTSVQVVPRISSCNGNVAQPGTSYGGCAARGGPVLLRDAATETSEDLRRRAQIWAHELAHAQGLIGSFGGYINSHNPKSTALMYETANLDRWDLSSQECSRIYGRQLFPPRPVTAGAIEEGQPEPYTDDDFAEMDSSAHDAEHENSNSSEPPQEFGTEYDEHSENDVLLNDDFLRGEWLDGIPIEIIDDNQEELLEKAQDAIESNNFELWPGSAVVIAYAGTENAFQLLEKIIFTDVATLDLSPISDDFFQINEAKVRAAGALSYIIFRGDLNGSYPDDEDVDLAHSLLIQLALSQIDLNNVVQGDDDVAQAFQQGVILNAISGIALIAAFDDDASEIWQELRESNFDNDLVPDIGGNFFAHLDNNVMMSNARLSAGNWTLNDALSSWGQQ
jgi:hypothetical protein